MSCPTILACHLRLPCRRRSAGHDSAADSSHFSAPRRNQLQQCKKRPIEHRNNEDRDEEAVLPCHGSVVAGIASTGGLLQAAAIGVWQNGGSVSCLSDEVSLAGQTAVNPVSLSAGSLSGLDAPILLNSDNAGYASGMVSAAPEPASFARAGGEMRFYDRDAGNTPSTLHATMPGNYTFNVVWSLSSNLDLPLPASVYLSGLTNSSFDGGACSAHGDILLGDLPGGAASLINVQRNPDRVVDFTYAYGSGPGRYSTIPSDSCGHEFGSPSLDSDVSTYNRNTVSAMEAVPEPGAAMLFGVGCGLLAPAAAVAKLNARAHASGSFPIR